MKEEKCKLDECKVNEERKVNLKSNKEEISSQVKEITINIELEEINVAAEYVEIEIEEKCRFKL